jgi:hypothetical protein
MRALDDSAPEDAQAAGPLAAAGKPPRAGSTITTIGGWEWERLRSGSPPAAGTGSRPASAGRDRARADGAPKAPLPAAPSDTPLGIKANGTYFRVPTAFALQLVAAQELPLQLEVGGRRLRSLACCERAPGLQPWRLHWVRGGRHGLHRARPGACTGAAV